MTSTTTSSESPEGAVGPSDRLATISALRRFSARRARYEAEETVLLYFFYIYKNLFK